MMYLGDFAEDATVYFQFTTNAADGGRESFSASLEEADIVIFKNNSAMTLDASTITITSDVGSRTGVHTVSVDMSNDADFTTGAEYSAVLYASDETLDSQAPAGVLALWSCENRTGAGLSAIPWNSSWDAEVQSEVNDALVALGLDHLISTSVTGTDVADDSIIALMVSSGGTADWDDFANDTDSLQAIRDYAASAASVIALNDLSSADVNAACDAAIETYGLDHLVSASVTGTDIADDSIIASMVSSSGTADWDTFVNTTDSLQAVRDRGDAAWTTGAGGTPPQLLQSTTIATLASQTSFTLTAGSADDDAYNGHLAIVTDQSTSTQKCVGVISDYTGSSKTITLDADPGVFTMATGDSIDIVAVNTAASAPTVTQIRQEMDSNSTQLAKLGTVTDLGSGSTLADNLADMAGATFSTSTDSLEAVRNRGDSAWITATGFSTLVASDILSDGTALNTTDGVLDSVTLVATTTTNSDMRGTDNAALASVCTETRLAELDAANLPTDISNLNDISAAEVNAEVVDALNVDTYAEPSQGTPAATASLVYKIGLLYKALRNKVTQDATTFEIYNDDATTVDHKATVSDDGTDFTRNELTTGP